MEERFPSPESLSRAVGTKTAVTSFYGNPPGLNFFCLVWFIANHSDEEQFLDHIPDNEQDCKVLYAKLLAAFSAAVTDTPTAKEKSDSPKEILEALKIGVDEYARDKNELRITQKRFAACQVARDASLAGVEALQKWIASRHRAGPAPPKIDVAEIRHQEALSSVEETKPQTVVALSSVEETKPETAVTLVDEGDPWA